LIKYFSKKIDMENLVTVIHVLAAVAVIGLVLLQHGKGADMGAAFGSGASGSLFGVSGSANFMSRATAICVAVFFTTSLTLAYLSGHRPEHTSIIKATAVTQTAPQTKGANEAAAPAALPATPPSTAKDVPQ
jgi:preprotein translocase subunit SecG